jgi:regulatory protein
MTDFLSVDSISSVVEKKQDKAAFSYAIRLLGRREYCEAEICNKFRQREYPPDCMERVITQLKDGGYLSEKRFAAGYLDSRLRKGEAPWLAACKARQKGVKDAAIEDALDGIETTFDGFSACRVLLDRRDPHGLRFTDNRVWQRQARYLRNKGYDTATILRCLNEKP